jgi:hypothetical protein
MIAELNLEQRPADFPPHRLRKRLQVAAACADEHRRLDRAQRVIHGIIVILL